MDRLGKRYINSGKSDIKERSLAAYEYFRDEIKREDAITGQRVTFSLSLQGLLIASVTLLLSNGVSKDVPTRDLVVQFRQLALMLIIGLGIIFSIISMAGIEASIGSINRAIDKRKKDIEAGTYNNIIHLPNPYGQGIFFKLGRIFPTALVASFGVFWITFGIFYYILIFQQNRISFLPVDKIDTVVKNPVPRVDVEVNIADCSSPENKNPKDGNLVKGSARTQNASAAKRSYYH